MLSITTYSLFNLQVTFPNLPDLRRFDLVDPLKSNSLNTTNIYISAAYTSLETELESFIRSSNFYTEASNTQLVKDLFVQSTWKIDNTEYISSLYQFIVLYYSQLTIDEFVNKEKAGKSFFIQNFNNVVGSLAQYEKLIDKNILSFFEDSIHNLLIYSLIA